MAKFQKKPVEDFLATFFVKGWAVLRISGSVYKSRNTTLFHKTLRLPWACGRHHSSDEFIYALELVTSDRATEISDAKIKYGSVSCPEPAKASKTKKSGATLSEFVFFSASEEQTGDGRNSSINGHLVESMGDSPATDFPQVEPGAGVNRRNEQRSTTDTTAPASKRHAVDDISSVMHRADKTKAKDKMWNKLVYFIPVVIFLIGIVAYFTLIPNIYGGIIVDWLFTNPKNIIEMLHDSASPFPKTNSVNAIRFFWWIWLAGLIASLFLVGKQLHSKPGPNAENAILIKKEPYLMIQDVSSSLKQLKTRRTCKQLDSLIYVVKKLEEKLSVESDFGYGKSAVINCENDIAKQIRSLLDIIPDIENGNFEENLKTMSSTVANINSLLHRRIELKKE